MFEHVLSADCPCGPTIETVPGRGTTFFPESDPVADGARRANDLIDPRKRAMAAVRNMAADWYCPFDSERQRIDCPECIAAVALDAYEGVQRLDHGITS